MLLTPEFVVINFPKTGSTFVRNVLLELEKKRLYAPFLGQTLTRLGFRKPQVKELLLPHPFITNYSDQHGSVSMIPKPYQHLPIVSVARNPVDRFNSLYRFGWWKKFPHLPTESLDKWPNFPELSTQEFLEYMHELGAFRKALLGVDPAVEIGEQTLQFVRMFATNPQKTLNELTQSKLESGEWISEMATVHWLQQEHLNDDLAVWMLNHGYTTEDAEWIKKQPPKNESPGTSFPIEKCIRAQVLETEKYLLRYFSSQNLNYT